MIAFDTNLLVRFAVNDDQYQADMAEQIISNNEVFISRTVLLETEGYCDQYIKSRVVMILHYFSIMSSLPKI